jgi:hypothetical protein
MAAIIPYSFKCRLHPKYKAIRAPRSKKKDCLCYVVWFLKCIKSSPGVDNPPLRRKK